MYVDVFIFVYVTDLSFYFMVTQVTFSVKLSDLYLGDTCLEFVHEPNTIFQRF